MAVIDVSGAVTALSTVVGSVGLVGGARLGVDAAVRAFGFLKESVGAPSGGYGDWTPATQAEMDELGSGHWKTDDEGDMAFVPDTDSSAISASAEDVEELGAGHWEEDADGDMVWVAHR